MLFQYLFPNSIFYRDHCVYIILTKFPPNEELFLQWIWQFQFSCISHWRVNIVRTMQRIFATFTKPLLLSTGVSRGMSSIIISPATSFLQCILLFINIYYIIDTKISLLGIKTLFPAFSLIAQSCVSPILDNGLIYLGRPRRMPKKVSYWVFSLDLGKPRC